MKSRIFFIIAIIVALSSSASAQAFCDAGGVPAGVSLEVNIEGRGMISPKGRKLFFRLYESGLVEYDALTRGGYVRRKSRLNARKVGELRGLLGDADFLAVKERYAMLEDMHDAVLRTCVLARAGDGYKRILITNYMPGHEAAGGYYPGPLVTLLQRVSEVRPQTSYEREHSLGSAGLP
jgi:hypothetical protein